MKLSSIEKWGTLILAGALIGCGGYGGEEDKGAIASAVITASQERIFEGEIAEFNAAGSVYDTIEWEVNATLLEACTGLEVCQVQLSIAGDYEVAVVAKGSDVARATAAVTVEKVASTKGTLAAGNSLRGAQASLVGGAGGGVTSVDSPTDVSSLVLWFDAHDIDSLFQSSDCTTTAVASNNDPVACWKDKSGLNNHLVQSTANRQPLYKTGILNSQATIQFDGSSSHGDYLNVASSAGVVSGDMTAFVVVQTHSVAKNGNIMGNATDVLGNTDTDVDWGYSIDSSGQFNAKMTSADGSTLNNHTSDVSVNQFYLASATWDGTTHTLYFNGEQVATQNAALTLGEEFDFHVAFSSNSTRFLDGDIAEIVIYDTKLNNAKRTQVEQLLANKWGLYHPTGDNNTAYHPNAAWISNHGTPVQVAIHNGRITESQLSGASNILGLWFDADDADSIVSSGGAVSQWNDKSGHGNHATQGTAGMEPTTGSQTLNGKNVLTFDGGDNIKTAAGGYDETLFIVFNKASGFTSSSSAESIFAVIDTGAWHNISFGAFTSSLSGEVWGFLMSHPDFRAASNTSISAGAHVITVRQQASATELFIDSNGESSPLESGGHRTFADDVPVSIGGYDETIRPGPRFFTGDIAEVISYSTALSDTEKATVISYLNTKWGL